MGLTHPRRGIATQYQVTVSHQLETSHCNRLVEFNAELRCALVSNAVDILPHIGGRFALVRTSLPNESAIGSN